jgi:amidase
MRYLALGTTLLFLATASLTQAGKVADAAEGLNGHWLVTADLHGTPIYGRLDVEVQGQKITGEYYGDKFEGSLDGSAIHFVAKDSSGGTSKVDAALKRRAIGHGGRNRCGG